MAAQRPRRVTLPGAADLFFRSTSAPHSAPQADPSQKPPEPAAREEDGPGERLGTERTVSAPRPRKPRARTQRAPQPSGRQRHEEKITVYISAAELLALEQTRLTLRAEHGLTVDRGRIVREAVAVLLADFEEHGETSMLVQRLGDD
ncbi:hypothetical protein [Marinactinospora rubrisoli]|uniref:Cobyrinic acid a,c-diamide synthase n=1 Tax=Marinactinospora rubrisoli TaxID=2715399 RepID=A0ABW2KGU8_9ACTN